MYKKNNEISYWKSFYSKMPQPFYHSLFAEFCVNNFFVKSNRVLELGCGNGRDSIFMSEKGMKVVALDQCSEEIEFLREKYSSDNLQFLCEDFTKFSTNDKFDAVYSRFTLHSITEIQEDNVVEFVSSHLYAGGFFCIEARGLNNELYGKGIIVKGEENAFIFDDHYRRFIAKDKLIKKLILRGFKIIYAEEDISFAPYNNENQNFMRIVAKFKK